MDAQGARENRPGKKRSRRTPKEQLIEWMQGEKGAWEGVQVNSRRILQAAYMKHAQNA